MTDARNQDSSAGRPDGDLPEPPPAQAARESRPTRVLPVVSLIAAGVVATVLVSAGTNTVLDHGEHLAQSYGELLDVGDDFDFDVDWDPDLDPDGNNGTAVELLGRYGSADELAPLVRELDRYEAVVSAAPTPWDHLVAASGLLGVATSMIPALVELENELEGDEREFDRIHSEEIEDKVLELLTPGNVER